LKRPLERRDGPTKYGQKEKPLLKGKTTYSLFLGGRGVRDRAEKKKEEE